MSRTGRAAALSEQVSEATEKLFARQADITALAAASEKDVSAVAVESAEIQAAASGIIRVVEELLTVTRSLKESWVLGQVAAVPADVVDEHIQKELIDKSIGLLSQRRAAESNGSDVANS